MIRDFSPRIYQQTILATAVDKNTLVVLPTGLGKTHIFLMLAAQRLKMFPNSKILFLGPTRPLVNQYYDVFVKHFEIDIGQMAVFTGQVSPKKREELWLTSKIIFSTPQGLENDIISDKIKLEEVSLIGFDEAHRAVGDYSYVWIASQYLKKCHAPRIIGLTASPGSDQEKIMEVIQNLGIEDVEIRTDEDPDVKPYVQDVKIKWVYVELPTHFKSIQKYLNDCYDSKLAKVNGYMKVNVANKTDLLASQRQLLVSIKENRDLESMKSLSLVAEMMKIQHAIELLESQGITPLKEYLESIFNQAKTTKVRAVQNLANDINFKSALVLTRNLNDSKIEHPKYTGHPACLNIEIRLYIYRE